MSKHKHCQKERRKLKVEINRLQQLATNLCDYIDVDTEAEKLRKKIYVPTNVSGEGASTGNTTIPSIRDTEV